MELHKQIQPTLKKEVLRELVLNYQSQLTEDAKKYLEDRGVKKESIEKFSIGFEKDFIGFQPKPNDYLGYFHNRIIFPLVSMENQLVDLIGRSIDDKEPKYKSLLGIDNVFFNEVVLNTSEDVILGNSIFDVVSLDQANLPSICMISNQMDQNKLDKLKDKRVFLCFGNDEIGRRESIRIGKYIKDFVSDLYIIHLPEGLKDINDFFIRVKDPVEEFIRLINQTLKNSLSLPISPDSHYLIHFQEEYLKRNKGMLSGIKTGFDALDSLLIGGLQEGLYLVGGEVFAGKTSFLKQMTDHIAETIPVIFISWDMSSFELWVRSMSRLTDQSSKKIIAGQVPINVIQEANQKYLEIAKNIWTVEADIESSLGDIVLYINKIMQRLNKKPVLILDHLQKIKLSKDTGFTSKEIQIQITYKLHYLSRQWGIPILLAANGSEENLYSDLLASVDVYMQLDNNTSDSNRSLKIKKNKNGTIGTIEMLFEHDISKFSEKSKNID